MVRLFDGEVDVAHMQFYVETPDMMPGDDVERRYGGQNNGLCGAGEAGMLQCTTGLHTGPVPVTVDLLDTAPDDVDTGWEEVVEVSLTTTTPHVLLFDWDHQHPVELPLGEGTFRVRYHATGMDAGRDADVRQSGEPVLDRYLLQFWPAPPAPDSVLRQTSEIAGYWHDTARHTPDPTTPEARAEAAAHDAERAAFHALMDRMYALGPDRLRAAARWLAGRAAEAAGPVTAAWVGPALEALKHDRPLPEPFAGSERDALAATHRDLAPTPSEVAPEPAPATTDEQGGGPPGPGANDREPSRAPSSTVFAVRALFAATHPDPSLAFGGTLTMTTLVAGVRDVDLHAELRDRYLS